MVLWIACSGDEIEPVEIAPQQEDTGLGVVFTDQWTPTAGVCGWEAWEAYTHSLYTIHLSEVPYYPNEACIDAVLEDFSVNVADLLEGSSASDPYGMVEDVDSATHPVIDTVLSGARPLFTLDYGSVQTLEESELISTEYALILRQVAKETGVTGLNAALYNHMTSIILETTSGESDNATAWFNAEKRRLVIDEMSLAGGAASTALLVHEVRHAYGYLHITCLNPNLQDWSCDDGIDGAWGFSLATWVRLYQNESSFQTEIQIEAQSDMEYIHRFQSKHGVVEDVWLETDLDLY